VAVTMDGIISSKQNIKFSGGVKSRTVKGLNARKNLLVSWCKISL